MPHQPTTISSEKEQATQFQKSSNRQVTIVNSADSSYLHLGRVTAAASSAGSSSTAAEENSQCTGCVSWSCLSVGRLIAAKPFSRISSLCSKSRRQKMSSRKIIPADKPQHSDNESTTFPQRQQLGQLAVLGAPASPTQHALLPGASALPCTRKWSSCMQLCRWHGAKEVEG